MKKFYDPHPGKGGASIELPESIVLAVKELDGKEIKVSDAVKTIQNVADLLVSNRLFGNAKAEDQKDCIILTLTEGEGRIEDFPKHSFRVIRYK